MSEIPEFVEFPKMPRLSREIVVTEKLDGTNAQVFITDDGGLFAGSRTRWITPEDDNYGFARWAYGNKDDLLTLGPGSHFGEWWGAGIQRKYSTGEKRFSLFNVSRWGSPDSRPDCCDVVPTLYVGDFTTDAVEACIARLRVEGSTASPGFMNPEGVVIFHMAGRVGFKKTLHKDEVPKALAVTHRSEP